MPGSRRKRKIIQQKFQELDRFFRERSSLPTIEEAFKKKPYSSGLKIISDNSEPGTVRYLERCNGFRIVSIKKTNAKDMPDEDIYCEALRLEALVLTHDKDFENYRRFDLRLSPGVVILPANMHGRSSPETYMPLRIALDHFINYMPHTIEKWLAKVVRYTRDGEIFTYSLPLRPHRNGSKPTTGHSRYIHQAL